MALHRVSLLLLLVSLAATQVSGQHCKEGDGHGSIRNGGSFLTSGSVCKQFTCERGLVRTALCARIPARCTEVSRDPSKQFPDCCAKWCCGSQCEGLPSTGGGTGGSSLSTGGGTGGSAPSGSCLGGALADGAQRATTGREGCQRQTCTSGTLHTASCGTVPPSCTVTTQNDAAVYPDCCPKWCCGSQCGGRPSTGTGSGGGSGTGGSSPGSSSGSDCNIKNGGGTLAHGGTQPASNCRQFSCNRGTLTTHKCRDTPSHCTFVSRDLTQDFPHCCPNFRC